MQSNEPQVTMWEVPAHEPYTFIRHDQLAGLNTWRNNVTGYYEDWLVGTSPLRTGKYAGQTMK